MNCFSSSFSLAVFFFVSFFCLDFSVPFQSFLLLFDCQFDRITRSICLISLLFFFLCDIRAEVFTEEEWAIIDAIDGKTDYNTLRKRFAKVRFTLSGYESARNATAYRRSMHRQAFD